MSAVYARGGETSRLSPWLVLHLVRPVVGGAPDLAFVARDRGVVGSQSSAGISFALRTRLIPGSTLSSSDRSIFGVTRVITASNALAR